MIGAGKDHCQISQAVEESALEDQEAVEDSEASLVESAESVPHTRVLVVREMERRGISATGSAEVHYHHFHNRSGDLHLGMAVARCRAKCHEEMMVPREILSIANRRQLLGVKVAPQ